MKNEIDVNEIVKIETMPKVFSQLEKIGKFIDDNIKDIDKLECTEENKQEVKKRRVEINNTLKILEDKRKEIKTTLLEPYETFNDKYENECKVKLQNASDLLKEKIDVIESQQLQEKENELREFANQHIRAYNLQDIIKYEDIGLNVTLSASTKSLKEETLKFIEKISNDVELIKLEEYSDEILLEYINNRGNYAHSKLNVLNRHKQLEEIKKQQEVKQEQQKQDEVIIHNIETLVSAPKEVVEEEKNWFNFECLMTIEQAKELKQWLKDRNIETR